MYLAKGLTLAINKGIAPLDPDTPVGEFRLMYGDTQFGPLDPPETGFGNYGELSDAEIEMYVGQGGDSVKRGIGLYNLALSTAAAKESKSVKDYDLMVDLTKRVREFRENAQMWFDLADKDDIIEGFVDIFDVHPTGGRRGSVIPEGTLPQVGRVYQWEVL